MSGIVHNEALGHRASTKRSLAEYRAKTLPRFYLMRGDLFLHWSGTKLTDKRSEAYTGSASQAVNIQKSITLAAQCLAVEVEV